MADLGAVKFVESYKLERFITDGLNSGKFGHGAVEILSEIYVLERDDVAPVVRCKACKYWKPSGAEAGNLFENMEPIGGCIYANFFRKASEFCSRGERRNDG